MLHVRVVSPAGRTGQLVETLATLPGVQNLVVQAGARRPEGDAVVFDVRDGSANPVFATLRELDLDRDGLIAVQRVDAVLDHTAAPVKRTRYMAPEIAPVWEMVEATIRAGGVYAPSFYVLLTIAGLIGAVGILTNSQILIVGAMVVGPVTPTKYLVGVRPVADLINTPNLFSVVVAVLAGIVGVVSLTEARANALIGVFISVTTIPARDLAACAEIGRRHLIK